MGIRCPIVVCLTTDYAAVKEWLVQYSRTLMLDITHTSRSAKYTFIHMCTSNTLEADGILVNRPDNLNFKVYSEKALHGQRTILWDYENRDTPNQDMVREYASSLKKTRAAYPQTVTETFLQPNSKAPYPEY